MYDRRCDNGHELIDCWEPVTVPTVICPECAANTTRVWFAKASAVIQDSIEGGVWIKHGICNPDGSPRKYYSKSEMAAEAKRRNVTNVVRHTTKEGTDKSPFTSKWY